MIQSVQRSLGIDEQYIKTLMAGFAKVNIQRAVALS